MRIALLVLVTACTIPDEPELSDVESEEIGICGANLDANRGGVSCSYYYYWAVPNTVPVFDRAVPFEDDEGFDWVNCVWTAQCEADATAFATNSWEQCHHVVGNGCPHRVDTTEIVETKFLPAGTLIADLGAFCRSFRKDAYNSRVACRDLHNIFEQYDDVCCVPRPPRPVPISEPTGE